MLAKQNLELEREKARARSARFRQRQQIKKVAHDREMLANKHVLLAKEYMESLVIPRGVQR